MATLLYNVVASQDSTYAVNFMTITPIVIYIAYSVKLLTNKQKIPHAWNANSKKK